ncbi:MAG: hypothetical protein ACK5LT_09010 [Lachnospirales bacterium]
MLVNVPDSFIDVTTDIPELDNSSIVEKSEFYYSEHYKIKLYGQYLINEDDNTLYLLYSKVYFRVQEKYIDDFDFRVLHITDVTTNFPRVLSCILIADKRTEITQRHVLSWI